MGTVGAFVTRAVAEEYHREAPQQLSYVEDRRAKGLAAQPGGTG
jgi:hypothetical protein